MSIYASSGQLGLVMLVSAASANADVSVNKVESAIKEFFHTHPTIRLVYLIDTKTSDAEDSIIAYATMVYPETGNEYIGTAQFQKLDSGSWYLMCVYVGSKNAYRASNLLRVVDID